MILRNALFLRYARLYKWYLIAGTLCVIVTNFFLILIPRLFKFAVDAIGEKRAETVLLTVEIIIAAALLGAVSRFAMRYLLFTTGRRVEQDIRDEFFLQLLRLPQEYYQMSRIGDLQSKTINDIDHIRYLFGHIIMQIANIVSLYLFAIVSLATIDLPLTLISLLPFPLLFVISRRFSRLFFLNHKDVMEKLSDLSTMLHEQFSAIVVVKSYVQENNAVLRLEKANQDFVDSNLQLARIRGIYHPFVAGFASLSALLILWIGGILVINGHLSLGEFVAFNGTLVFLIRPTVFIGWLVNLYQRSKAALERINEVLSYEDVIGDAPHVDKDPIRLTGAITVRNLSYTVGSSTILSDISLHIPAGQMVAIIGEIGCGKSTLLKLLLRIIRPPLNRVFYDEHEQNHIPYAILRAHVAYVSQEPVIFSGTIRENIAYPDPEFTDAQVTEAALFAGLGHDLDQFGQGLDTVVGEHGITLSGGQKQRISLARAIIKKPAILVLDNAFSAVDTETEDHILQNLLTLRGAMTIIMVAHRISTLKHCDSIVILDKGHLSAQGTHEELLRKNRTYERVYEKQSL